MERNVDRHRQRRLATITSYAGYMCARNEQHHPTDFKNKLWPQGWSTTDDDCEFFSQSLQLVAAHLRGPPWSFGRLVWAWHDEILEALWGDGLVSTCGVQRGVQQITTTSPSVLEKRTVPLCV